MNLRVKNVPDIVHRTLKAQAAMAGITLNARVVEVLTAAAKSKNGTK